MLLAAVMFFGVSQSVDACERLTALRHPNATVVMAETVPRGSFTPPASPGAGGPAPAPMMLPAHCRVKTVLKPTSDSHIEVEVWLPLNDWNGKFQAVGNGGWAGVISYPAMSVALQEGYATASTDTGHSERNALFAIDHPEKLNDFAYRAVHEMTVAAKALITQFYKRPPRLSYWNGCSTGGRQGLMEAQKFPEDYDAIVAGAPANYQTHLHLGDLVVSSPVLRNPAAALTPAKLTLVNNAVLNACDGRDGVSDGILNDPRACKFDVATLVCRGADAATCLTGPQVESLKRAYDPARTRDGGIVFPGKELGSETSMMFSLGGMVPAVSIGSFQVAYNDPNWDPASFDIDRDLPLLQEKVGTTVNAVSPDLRAFKARGGKLLLYHGWNDTLISPGNTINYYSSVQSTMGGTQDDFIRLFMVPGMQHCNGGPGPNQVHWMGALERWREAGVAPESIKASRVTTNRVDMTRPVCRYPQLAVYKGVGSTNDAENFMCK